MKSDDDIIQEICDDWDKKQQQKLEERTQKQEWLLNLVKLGQAFGVSFLPSEAEAYEKVLDDLMALNEKFWPRDRAARRRMLNCFAVLLQYEATNDEVAQILEEEE